MRCAFSIRPQMPENLPTVEALHENAFGPGRFARTAYRIRETATRPPLIALTAWHDGHLMGAIQFAAVSIGGQRGALLLGPLAIAPEFKNQGCGLRLMQQGMAEAERLGSRLVILIGDLPYYSRAGFRVIPPGQIRLPGPADPARFLAAELQPGALAEFSGMVAADNEEPVLRPAEMPGQAAPPHPVADAPALSHKG